VRLTREIFRAGRLFDRFAAARSSRSGGESTEQIDAFIREKAETAFQPLGAPAKMVASPTPSRLSIRRRVSCVDSAGWSTLHHAVHHHRKISHSRAHHHAGGKGPPNHIRGAALPAPGQRSRTTPPALAEFPAMIGWLNSRLRFARSAALEEVDPTYRRLRRRVFAGSFHRLPGYYLFATTSPSPCPTSWREHPQYSKPAPPAVPPTGLPC